ncbi:hypothetical protein KDRO_A02400 [Kluyveromyces lactis]|nr:hypothetical protein KDRO_A02400 [Kluyveromyces lactis]
MSEQPSLVGHSVRDIDDSENPDFVPEKMPDFSQLNESVRRLNLKNSSPDDSDQYTSVAELNKEGALLTDDQDVDLDDIIAKGLDDISELKSSLENKKKIKNKKKTKKSSSSGSLSQDFSYSISPVHSGTVDSLVTSTDPIDDNIVAPTAGDITDGGKSRARSTNKTEKRVSATSDSSHSVIRNSYGEIINDNSERPHLARGDSYQQSVDDLENSASNGRSGRSTSKRFQNDYLRSLSRSLQRDHADHKSVSDDTGVQAQDIYSTTSYSISQRYVENAPHVIRESHEEHTARHPAAPHRN